MFDGIGHQSLVEVVSIANGEITARLVERLADDPVPATRINVAVAIVKGSRMDYAVEKAAETGASKLVPLLTDRSIISPRERRVERWREIAKSAAKQSRRAHLMEVTNPLSLPEALAEAKGSAVALHLSDRSMKLAEVIHSLSEVPEVTLFIGAEGGFSHSEIELFQSHNTPFATLVPHTLRTETAVAVSVAITRMLL
jgi:16S rRNA (uracil1498-N3)-methyltransferase